MKITTNAIFYGIFVIALVIGFGFVPAIADSGNPATPEVGHVHKHVTGTVSKIQSGTVYLETDEGTTRTLSLKNVRSEMAQELKKGDRVRLELEEGNQIIDIDRVSDDDSLMHPEDHLTLTGEMLRFDPLKKMVTLKLNDGRSITYGMKDAAAIKMKMAKVGDIVEVQIDEENSLINDILIR